MKKKILWISLSFLLVTALVLTGCPAPEEPVVEEPVVEEPVLPVVEEPVTEEPVVPVEPVGEPQYGGTLTYIYYAVENAGTPGTIHYQWPASLFQHPVSEYIYGGDIAKYGPRGTGEYDFKILAWVPFPWYSGILAESWEASLDKLVFHIRPGCYFTPNLVKPDMMERREYTADDFVFNINLRLDGIGFPGAALRDADLVKSVYAMDKYTAVIETKYFHSEWFYLITGHGGNQWPHEMFDEAGRTEWANVVGTGPFVIKEFNPVSHFTYARNPNYWRTTTINGVEYELPFVDELIEVIMFDISTVIAALRTATVEMFLHTPGAFKTELAQTAPELLVSESRLGNPMNIFLRNDVPPFDNVDVRRAFFIATDRKAIHEAVLEIGTLYASPLDKGVPGHVPLEELPPETRILFDYNPELARQMLRDAGVPEGFKMEMLVATRPDQAGVGEMVAGMWEEDLGIEIDLKVIENVEASRMAAAREYKHSYVTLNFNMLPITHLSRSFRSGREENYSMYSNPYFDELLETARATLDEAEREAMLEELFVMVLDEAVFIPISMHHTLAYWWPWVKGYYGENARVCLDPDFALMWLDQDLKAEMGY